MAQNAMAQNTLIQNKQMHYVQHLIHNAIADKDNYSRTDLIFKLIQYIRAYPYLIHYHPHFKYHLKKKLEEWQQNALVDRVVDLEKKRVAITSAIHKTFWPLPEGKELQKKVDACFLRWMERNEQLRRMEVAIQELMPLVS